MTLIEEGKNQENTGLKIIMKQMDEIICNVQRIDNKIHNHYTIEELEKVQNEIYSYLRKADEKYRELKLGVTENVNNEKYKEIEALCSNLNNKTILKNLEAPGVSKEDIDNIYRKLFDRYIELTYNFQTAAKETKEIQDGTVPEDTIGMILLCKNVQIMEDLINKICSNNIDKSIIGGDKHFDSMSYGFDWLYCHNNVNRSASYKRIDIRDRNRYLDYIKYQIMVASKYIDNSPKSSTEIDHLYQHFLEIFDEKEFEEKKSLIQKFKKDVTKLIRQFFSVYELLTEYRDKLFREEDIRKEIVKANNEVSNFPTLINTTIINLSFVAVRVLLDRFVSFVKISDLNFGNSIFNRSWFNYSELSNSNYAGSNFKNARLENAKVKGCDISTCNLSLADGGQTDFSNSNFNYSDLTGMNLNEAILNNCEFQNALFRDRNIDSYHSAVRDIWGQDLREDERAGKLIEIWESNSYNQYEIKDIISEFRKIVPLDLEMNVGRIGWAILKCNLTEEIKRNLAWMIRSIITVSLESHISAELLSLLNKKVAHKDMKRIVKKYGKVLLDIADLEGVSAKYAQLSKSDLCHIMMYNASFENADLSNTVMYYTKAQAVSFIFSNMNKADCFESDYCYSNFTKAVLNETLFLNCNLNHTNFNKAILIGTEFVDFSKYVENTIYQQNADAIHIQFEDCFEFKRDEKEQRVILDFPREITLTESRNDYWQKNCGVNDSSFVEVLADNSVFINIEANRCTFNHALFRHSFLANCKMCLSDFVETDFRYANIILCCLGQSNFTDANMTSTVIHYVDFTNSNLTGSLFNLSKLNHVLFENTAMKALNFSGTIIKNSAFINSQIIEVVMSEAKFINCIFSHIDFSNLIGAHSASFEKCYFQYCTYDSKGITDGVISTDEFKGFVKNRDGYDF